MSFDQRLRVTEEAIQLFGPHLPPDIRAKSTAEVAMNTKFLIRTIARIVDMLRRRIGKYDT